MNQAVTFRVKLTNITNGTSYFRSYADEKYGEWEDVTTSMAWHYGRKTVVTDKVGTCYLVTMVEVAPPSP